jgi:hypothetical protein
MLIDLMENLLSAAAFGAVTLAALAGLAARVVAGPGPVPARAAAPVGRAPLPASGRFPDGTAWRPSGYSDPRLGSLPYGRRPARERWSPAGAGQ